MSTLWVIPRDLPSEISNQVQARFPLIAAYRWKVTRDASATPPLEFTLVRSSRYNDSVELAYPKV